MLKVTDLDHIVVNVADVERAIAFYCDELGLAPVRVDKWRRHEVPFPSARVNTTTIIDLLPLARPGENIDHFCLVVEPIDLAEIAASGRFEVVSGPVRRYGARGDGMSLYVRDPDGNLVELRYYEPA